MPWNFIITGDDMLNLLFHFLDEFLFLMCADPYFIVKVSEIHISFVFLRGFVPHAQLI